MPLIICDLEEEKGDLVELKRRPSSARVFSLQELEREINSYDTCANFDLEPFPNTAIHGPQGQKCVSSDYVETIECSLKISINGHIGLFHLLHNELVFIKTHAYR